MSEEWPLWEVFIRGQHGLNHRHVGSLHAADAEQAIRNARDVYTHITQRLPSALMLVGCQGLTPELNRCTHFSPHFWSRYCSASRKTAYEARMRYGRAPLSDRMTFRRES